MLCLPHLNGRESKLASANPAPSLAIAYPSFRLRLRLCDQVLVRVEREVAIITHCARTTTAFEGSRSQRRLKMCLDRLQFFLHVLTSELSFDHQWVSTELHCNCPEPAEFFQGLGQWIRERSDVHLRQPESNVHIIPRDVCAGKMVDGIFAYKFRVLPGRSLGLEPFGAGVKADYVVFELHHATSDLLRILFIRNVSTVKVQLRLTAFETRRMLRSALNFGCVQNARM